jgi:hypothetical protein
VILPSSHECPFIIPFVLLLLFVYDDDEKHKIHIKYNNNKALRDEVRPKASIHNWFIEAFILESGAENFVNCRVLLLFEQRCRMNKCLIIELIIFDFT